MIADVTAVVVIVTEEVAFEQPVVPSVKVNVTVPAKIPVTNPALVTVAFEGSLLIQVPPEVGFKIIVLPTHKLDKGVLAVGNALTVIEVVPFMKTGAQTPFTARTVKE